MINEPRRSRSRTRDRSNLIRRTRRRWTALSLALTIAAMAVIVSGPALARAGLNPGPNDGLPIEEYERRIEGWCTGLVDDWGWTWDDDGTVTGWPGGCWRDDDRGFSHLECLDQGFEWDCPLGEAR